MQAREPGNWQLVLCSLPFSTRNKLGDTDYGILEQVESDEDGGVNIFAKYAFSGREFYHLGFELRTSEKGDGVGRSEQVIEAAVTQTLRGLNGFSEMLISHPYRIPDKKGIHLLPVVFTTAKLFVADVDLSTSELEIGKIKVGEGQIKSVPWLLYQSLSHPRSNINC